MSKITEQFITDAISGGWKPADNLLPRDFLWSEPFNIFVAGTICSIHFDTKIIGAKKENILIRVSDILLDPISWRGVSKTRNWNAGKRAQCPTCTPGKVSVDWRYYLHLFIEYIAMGRSIEEALATLINPQ